MQRYYNCDYQANVAQLAHYIKRTMMQSKDSNAAASFLVAGYDEEKETGRVFSIASGGALLEEMRFAAAGSGSTFVLGYLDHHVPNSQNRLSERDAIAICKQAMQLAMHRDASSGGLARLFICAKDGVRQETVYPEPCDAHELPGFATATRRDRV
jgi:20S proteasome alpha/beta subunit